MFIQTVTNYSLHCILFTAGMEEFEDLDEIIARYIQPMAAFARDITNHKYYVESEGGKRDIMEAIVTEEKRKAPSK